MLVTNEEFNAFEKRKNDTIEALESLKGLQVYGSLKSVIEESPEKLTATIDTDIIPDGEGFKKVVKASINPELGDILIAKDSNNLSQIESIQSLVEDAMNACRAMLYRCKETDEVVDTEVVL